MIPVVVGIVVAGAIIFAALYFSHKEKLDLNTKCADRKGYAKIDNRDKAGLKGTTSGGEAQKAGGYKFECIKK